MASRRSLWLIAALGLTLVSTWYAAVLEAPEGDEPLVEARLPDRQAAGGVASAPRPVGAAGTAAPLAARSSPAVPALAAARMTQASDNLFAPRSWQPPPPPPPPMAPPLEQEAVQAPPLPFKYLGRLEENGTVTVFLAEGNQRPRLVRKGDQLPPNHQVDDITAEGMQLTYLPLKQTQHLQFGNAN